MQKISPVTRLTQVFPAELADQDLGLTILWPLVSREAVPLALKAVFETDFPPGERRIERHVCVVCVNFDGCYAVLLLRQQAVCVVPI